MSALLTSRPRARDERRASGQELLFGDSPVVAVPPAAPAPQAAAPVAAPAGVTLDAAISSLWNQLTGGEAAACPVCEAPLEARHPAGAGVVSGRCRSCGSTLS